ncbi:MAG: HAD family hydrolase, partial [Phycisphaeraceae bacterium]|nr:HAD family hydrolase [Phycisphaeraceae bacterium]
AGIPHVDVPAAHADDAHPREKIIEIAMTRARESSGETFDRGVYVGDGRWDVLATDRMGLGFVGLAEGDRADLLRSVGATTVLPDYRDFSAFLEAVERLATPLAT